MLKKCPKCGNVTDSTFCGDCGTDLSNVLEIVEQKDDTKTDQPTGIAENEISDASVATTIETTAQVSENKEAINANNKKSKKPPIAIAIGAVVIIAIIAFAIVAKNQAAKEEYKTKLHTMAFDMQASAAATEDACNLISSVWYDAIFENYNEDDTKEYVKGASDFNEALSNLFADESFQQKISNIEEAQSGVREMMEELKNPPDEYKDIYNEALDVYADFSAFCDLAINPTGSYNSYSESFEELDSELAKKLKKFNTMLP